ncbi:HD domain-containing protein [Litchfieldia alkalitelluris]|uniref:HD domain-containing protein n=1 Tax=Litchfieldia alkalitelluris TaxID=304268 RepID=UPI00111725B9|nr:HD domain-containing protein [Litchfieldia alkalitelluris]
MISLAIEEATIAHHGQFRKLTNIPYITHPYNVGMYLAHSGCSDEVICAGILHDTVEDTNLTLEDIKNKFGSKVASYVAGSSEPNKENSWEERKQHTIDFLKTAPKEVCLIVCADKLHNIRSIIQDVDMSGESVWQKFKRGKVKQEWYYRGIIQSLSLHIKHENLFVELEEEVNRCFGDN